MPIVKLFTSVVALQNLNHMLYTDNWYTGLYALFLIIMMGSGFIGTVQKKRAGVPGHLGIPTSYPRGYVGWRPVRGDFKVWQTTILGVAVYFTAWFDNKPVHFISTLKPSRELCFRMIETPPKGSGIWNRQEVPKPHIGTTYNNGMGGTDSIVKNI
jgi:hypothetical protein